MGAAKHQSVRCHACFACFRQEIVEIDSRDFASHRMIDPPFLDQRYKQGAGLLNGPQATFPAAGGVSVAFDSGRGRNDQHVLRL